MTVKFTSLEKDPSAALFAYRQQRSTYFKRLAAAMLTALSSLVPVVKGHLTRQAIGDVCRKWGRAAGFHVHPHQLRHSHATHAVQRGVDVFTLQATLGHSSSATTGHYVAATLGAVLCVLVNHALPFIEFNMWAVRNLFWTLQ